MIPPPAPSAGAPPPPSLSLPSDSLPQFSQPLCTPVDRPILRANPHANPASPARRRRQPPAAPPSSQPQLPDMSQDTLALFPRVVAAVAAGAASAPPLPPPGAAGRPPRSGCAAGGGGNNGHTRSVAKASLIASLHEQPPLRNPFVKASDEGAPVRPAVSESFDLDDFEDGGSAGPSAAASAVRGGRVGANLESAPGGQVAALKASVVCASEPNSSLLHFCADAGVAPVRGGFSIVTRATSRIDGVSYALKRNAEPFQGAAEKLAALQEVFALAALQSLPGVVRYHGAWWEGGGRFLVLQCEWVAGGVVKGQKSLDEVVDFGVAVAKVLKEMHSKNMVHLDVKPENCLVGERNGETAFLVGDFGLARIVDPNSGAPVALPPTAGPGIAREPFVDGRSFDGDARYLCPEALDSTNNFEMHAAKKACSSPGDSDVDIQNDSVRALKRPGRELGIGAATARPFKRTRRVRPTRHSVGEVGLDRRTVLAMDESDDEEAIEDRDAVGGTSGFLRSISDFAEEEPGSRSMAVGGDQDITSTPVSSHFPGSLFGCRHHDNADRRDCESGTEDDEDDLGDSPVVLPEGEDGKSSFQADLASSPKLSAEGHLSPSQAESAAGPASIVACKPSPPSRNLMAGDVFSLGVSLYELATGEEPAKAGPKWHWLRMQPGAVGKRVEDSTGSEALGRIVQSCLTSDPSKRPTAEVLAKMFADLKTDRSESHSALVELEMLKAHNAHLQTALEDIAAAAQEKSRPRACINGPTKAALTKPVSKVGSKRAARRGGPMERYVCPETRLTCRKAE